MIRILAIICLLLGYMGYIQAAIETYQFEKQQQEQQYQKLINELRCLVCQNQNLADSNADLAKDLRHQVFEMINQGKSDKEIVDYMVQRYGEFVLYKPPLHAGTLLLWLGPFIFLLLAITIAILFAKRQQRTPIQEIDEAALQRARDILGSTNKEEEK